MTYQYRAVLTCNQDPCTYCREPARRIVPGEAQWKATEVAFSTPDEAYDYGLGMAQKVYGGEHTVSVERQEKAPWMLIGNLDEVREGVLTRHTVEFRKKWGLDVS